jgi:hypothetical protein
VSSRRKLVVFVPLEAFDAARDALAEHHDEVVAALRRAHPYEEPAFDVYPLL